MSLRTRLTSLVGAAARRTIERERPLVIAMTGSVGKSSARQMIAAILQASSFRDGLRVPQKNYNNELGIPLTVFDLPAPGRSPLAWIKLLVRSFWYGWIGGTTGIRTLVLEMGADKPGDLAYLTSLATPSISIITAVSPEHPEWAPVHAANYPTIDALAYEKSTLARALASDGTLILNADDARAIAMRHEAPEVVLLTFGTTDAADVRILSTRLRMASTPSGALPIGLEVKLMILQNIQNVYLPGVFGRSAAYALAASACVALALDLPIEDMLEGWARYAPLPGRARLIPGIKGTMLFDDTYNAAPASMIAGLRDLASAQVDEGIQRKIACLGEMRELGEQSEMLHEQVGLEAARLGIDVLVVTGAFAAAYVRGARLGGMKDEQIHVFDDTPELGVWVQDILRSGDLVFAKSSQGTHTTKGVRMERVIKELMAEPHRANEVLCRQEEVWQTRV